MNLKYAF
jgi:serine/threonine protein kinase